MGTVEPYFIFSIRINSKGDISVWRNKLGNEGEDWEEAYPSHENKELMSQLKAKTKIRGHAVNLDYYEDPCEVVWVNGYPYVECWVE